MKKYTVKITQEALEDFDQIGDYIAIKLEEPATALKILERIRRKCEKLSTFPKSSPVREKISGIDFRFAHCGNYTIAYSVHEAKLGVVVRAIIYSKRDILQILEDY